MKIALLGYGKEGKAVEKYFEQHYDNIDCDIFDNFTSDEIKSKDFSGYDYIFRSPSVPPLHLNNETSVTKYFFEHCPCKIIGVTGTKGKGTTCSLIASILKSIGQNVYLVGNIGVPSIDVLDNLTESDIVVYEMSSFQLWDLTTSPQIAVVLRIEPDHLNVHKDFDDYVDAKSHIAEFQSSNDSIIYFKDNQNSVKIAQKSPAKNHFSYPLVLTPKLTELLNSLKVPGNHNKENAEAALLAVSAYLNLSLDEFIETNYAEIKSALENFRGLPHHLEYVRTLNRVDYYDDSFSASSPSLEVAIKAFPDKQVVLIAGGKDRGLDLTPHKKAIFESQNVKKALLIGETKEALSTDANPERYLLFDDFKEAVMSAQKIAEDLSRNSETPVVVLLSPGSASFDMFKDFYERGDKFKQYVKGLK